MNERYFELEKELENHPGFMYLKRREVHSRSLKVFGGNYKDLISLIDAIQDYKFYLRQKSANTVGLLQSDLIRLLHNYLASAISLVDHTRSYVKKWHADDVFKLAYEDKVKSYFIDDKVARMTSDLRNYLLHRGFPSSTIRETFFVGASLPPDVRIIFKSSSVYDWKGWSKKSKEFISCNDGFFELRPLILEYREKISGFYTWFDLELNLLHEKELLDYKRLKDELGEFEND